jgi:hypothetical protein
VGITLWIISGFIDHLSQTQLGAHGQPVGRFAPSDAGRREVPDQRTAPPRDDSRWQVLAPPWLDDDALLLGSPPWTSDGLFDHPEELNNLKCR